MLRVAEKRAYVVDALSRYWPRNADPILALPIPYAELPAEEALPPRLVDIALPPWARDLAVNSKLLIPVHFAGSGETEESWRGVDWLGVAFWYLNGSAERAFERRHGAVHSYSFRLAGWDERLWERAWVNRIGLFLRRWAARLAQTEEESLFGPLPRAEIVMTHDVDAISKTLPIRFKQSAFQLFNAYRNLLRGDFAECANKIGKAVRFGVSAENYFRLHEIAEMELACKLSSHFFLYGGGGGWMRSPKALLFDPGYDVCKPQLVRELKELSGLGFSMGLHQSFDAWSSPELMRSEREYVEQATGMPVTACRQHWLRFSWKDTWQSQEQAGLALDTTLGFNDRPGFRNGSALRFRPLLGKNQPVGNFEALPMVLMDSHLFDYANVHPADDSRGRRWITEIRAVHGIGSVIWHPHTLAGDYGWNNGFRSLLAAICEH